MSITISFAKNLIMFLVVQYIFVMWMDEESREYKEVQITKYESKQVCNNLFKAFLANRLVKLVCVFFT